MLNRTFRAGVSGDMLDQFPVFRNASNPENLPIIRDGERILSCAGIPGFEETEAFVRRFKANA